MLVTTALAFASPAKAEWQYTRWGMSPSEVVVASGSTAELVAADEGNSIFGQQMLARAPYQAAGVTFRAEFLFSPLGHALSMVRLSVLDPRNCDALLGELRGRYGSPSLSDNSSRFGIVRVEWNVVAQNNHILFADVPAEGASPRLCHIIYRPISGVRGATDL